MQAAADWATDDASGVMKGSTGSDSEVLKKRIKVDRAKVERIKIEPVNAYLRPEVERR